MEKKSKLNIYLIQNEDWLQKHKWKSTQEVVDFNFTKQQKTVSLWIENYTQRKQTASIT
jgi:hypothetical protein